MTIAALGVPFTELDKALLVSHGLTLVDAHAAFLRRVTDEEGAQLVGQAQRRSAYRDFSGIAFPYIRDGRLISHQLRLNNPDLEEQSDGREPKEKNKYLFPPGERGHLYFAPTAKPEWFGDTTIDVVITEGCWKTLAGHRLALENNPNDRPRWLAVGLGGVWNFRGRTGKTTNANGKRVDLHGTIPDLDLIKWVGRRVKIVFDSDVATKAQVRRARRELAAELIQRGAIVEFVDVPDAPDGSKWGIDDWYGAEGATPVLRAMANGKLFELSAPNVLAIVEELPPEAPNIVEMEEVLSTIARFLVKASKLTAELVREGLVSALKSRGIKSAARIVDAALGDNNDVATGAVATTMFEETEPWPQPVDGADLLNEIVVAQKRFLFASESVYRLVALWTLFTHAFDCFDCLPILLITAPTKGAGKSTLLTLLRHFTRMGMLVSSMTPAVLYRIGEQYKPTLLIDEAETFMRDNEALRGVIDGGHTRSTALVPRCDGDNHEVKLFSTFYPKAIAGIGQTVPDTIEDRSIHAEVERASRAEQRMLEYLTLDRQKELAHLRAKAARWARDNVNALRQADPAVPDELTNARMRDNFRPLFAIADIAGSEWPARAREVASLAAGIKDTRSASELLLGDLNTYIRDSGLIDGDHIESEAAAKYLRELEDRPWPEWGQQKKPITPAGIARLLKPYKIRPVHKRDGKDTWRGYLVNDFADAFTRYCPNGTSGTELRINRLQKPETAQNASTVPDENKPNELKTNDCAGRAASESAGGGEESRGRLII